jgi:CRP-like cAMP-binding protein
MTALTVFDLLALHDFVADLPNGWLRRLAVYGRPVHYVAGYRMFREDGIADQFWLLHSGVVAVDFHVPGRGDIEAERIGAGAVVGTAALLPPYRWRLGALVVDDVRAVEFYAAGVRAIMAEDPDLGRELYRRLLLAAEERLEAARHRLVELYAYPSVRPASHG